MSRNRLWPPRWISTEGADATVVAGLTNSGDPTLAVYVNNADPVGAGEARIVLRHQAQAPAVDLLVNGEPVALEVANGDEAAAEVEAGPITLALVPSAEGGGDLFQTDVDLSEGSAFLIYGIGSVEGGSFDVAVQQVVGAADATGGHPHRDRGSGGDRCAALVAPCHGRRTGGRLAGGCSAGSPLRLRGRASPDRPDGLRWCRSP